MDFQYVGEENSRIAVIKLDEQVFGGVQAVDFNKDVHRFCEEQGACLIVDLGAVTLMNSSGLGMLVNGLTTMRKFGGNLKLVSVPQKVNELLKITRLVTVFDIYSSADEAVASCA